MPPKRNNSAAAIGSPASTSTQTPAPAAPGYPATGGLALPGAGAGWAGGHIPIDPALQSSPGYPNSYYAYQQYQYQQSSTSQYASMPPPSASRASTQQSGGAGEDLASLNDVLGSAGVDVRAEEEGLQRSHSGYRPVTMGQHQDRSRRQTQVDTQYLGTALRRVATHHKVPKVPDESVQYLAFALRARLEEIIKNAIGAAKHRTRTEVLDPAPLYEDGSAMWSKVVRRDVGKQLALLERVEREEEMRVRAERKERANAVGAGGGAAVPNQNGEAEATGADDEDGAGPKKKRKKEMGPGVTAKNMSEEVRKKMSNAVASHAAGLSTAKYAWMHAGNVPSGPAAKAKSAASLASAGTGVTNANAATPTTPGAGTGAAKGWARGPFVSSKEKSVAAPVAEERDMRMIVTLRDTMFVIEKERGHGGGRGSARGWT